MTTTTSPEPRLSRSDIDEAFASDQLIVHFQPQLSFETMDIIGVEAFVRWQHPKIGLLAPNLFINFMESQGRMHEVTDHVLAKALQAIEAARRLGLTWRVSVNVSLADLTGRNLPQALARAVKSADVSPGDLCIDVSEASLSMRYASDWPAVASTLSEVRRMGIGIALDGPGPRPFELRQIQPFVFSQVKIGGQAIIGFARTTVVTQRGLIPSRIAFCEERRIPITAIGMEDLRTLEALHHLGFERVQGNVIAPAMPLESLLSWYFNEFKAKAVKLEAALGLDRTEAEIEPEDTSDADDLEIPVTGSRKRLSMALFGGDGALGGLFQRGKTAAPRTEPKLKRRAELS